MAAPRAWRQGSNPGLTSLLPAAFPLLPLADSTVLRNVGVGVGHSILAYQSTLRGIRWAQRAGRLAVRWPTQAAPLAA